MISKSKHDKKKFFLQKFENLKIDSPRGAGAYIEAYAIVSQYDQNVRPEFYRASQKNFTSFTRITWERTRACLRIDGASDKNRFNTRIKLLSQHLKFGLMARDIKSMMMIAIERK